MKAQRGRVEVSSTLSLFSGIDKVGWTKTRVCQITPGEDQVHIVLLAGWVLGPVWKGEGNLVRTRTRSPDRAAHSESLHRVSYPGQNLPRQS